MHFICQKWIFTPQQKRTLLTLHLSNLIYIHCNDATPDGIRFTRQCHCNEFHVTIFIHCLKTFWLFTIIICANDMNLDNVFGLIHCEKIINSAHWGWVIASSVHSKEIWFSLQMSCNHGYCKCQQILNDPIRWTLGQIELFL